jgi:PAS domain S-box-containing protein
MFFLSGFWIFFDYKSFQSESERLRAKHMMEYEDMLRYQVDRVVSEIKYEQTLTEQKLKEYIKERTNDAAAIVSSIVNQNAGTIDPVNLKKVVKDSLRNIRFNNDNGYYFVINMNGTVEVNPVSPELEGQNIIARTNDQGQYVVADILEIARSSGEGFYQYNWSKPYQPGKEYPKISFVKYIKELDWVIGTGEYLDDFTAELQKDICQRVEQIRFGREEKDYVFVATWDGISKSFPATGKNMLETKDANGVFIVKELIKKAKSGGGFVRYVMPPIGGVLSKPKLSYAAPISEWEWYIGAGVYIDEIDTKIAENQQVFKERVVQHIESMLMLILGLLILHFIIAHFISRKIYKQIEMFSQFFRRASTESVSIESEILDYKEFREIGNLANIMLKERNAILQEIRLSRDEWINTFNAIGDCIMLLDGKGNIERANETALNLHGFSAENIVDISFSELCSYDNPVNVTLLDHAPHTAEIQNERLGKTFWASSFPLFSAEGELRRIIHIAHDITEQKRLEKQLVQAHKMEAIGTLAGGIAHDFNNILAAMIGYTELAEREITAGSKAAGYLGQVIQAGKRAKELVKQILAFSRHAETKKVPLQIASIVKEALKLLRSSLPTTITIEQDVDIKSSIILADPTQIHQIIMNLCTNAYHAMEQTGGVLSVTLKRTFKNNQDISNEPDIQPGEFVELSIGDNGPGIDPAIQDKIFDPFFTTKETGKGTGMGLAIVHGIVKNCGGFIACNSRLGKGTVFTIYMPVLENEHVLPESQTSGQSFFGTERILLVDDEIALADMSKIMLESLGYHITVSTSSLNALNIFTARPDAFDMVITDQTMPQMTGIDMARKILQVRPNIPIILCTGYSSIVSAEQAKTVGIKDFAMKPLVWRDIGQKIRKILDEGVV